MTDDERQISALVDDWMAASKAGDVSAILGLMTDDVVFLTPGRSPFGKEAFAAGAESMKGVAMDGQSDLQEIQVCGDYAFTRNHIRVTITAPGGPTQRLSGHTLSVLRKEADGRWRLARDANFVMKD